MNLLERTITTSDNGMQSSLSPDPSDTTPNILHKLLIMKNILTIRAYLLPNSSKKITAQITTGLDDAVHSILDDSLTNPDSLSKSSTEFSAHSIKAIDLNGVTEFTSCSLDASFINKLHDVVNEQAKKDTASGDTGVSGLYARCAEVFWPEPLGLAPTQSDSALHMLLDGVELVVFFDEHLNYKRLMTLHQTQEKNGVNTSIQSCFMGDSLTDDTNNALTTVAESQNFPDVTFDLILKAVWLSHLIFRLMYSLKHTTTLDNDLIIQRTPSKNKKAAFARQQKQPEGKRKTLFLSDHFAYDVEKEGIRRVRLEKLESVTTPKENKAEAIQPAPTGTNGKSWTLNHEVTVRGHWKNVRYGVGRSLTKEVWVEPFVKGEGLGEAKTKKIKTLVISQGQI